MKIRTNKQFDKQYHTLPTKIQRYFKSRLKLFMSDPGAPALRRHALKGEFAGFWSINITGDYRALYEVRGEELIFSYIGTHSQLYGT